MSMTEDQARETWCPHVRSGSAGNNLARCRASDCQMWKFDNRGGSDWQHLAHEAVEAFAKSSGLTAPPPPAVEHVGYCGLTRGPR